MDGEIRLGVLEAPYNSTPTRIAMLARKSRADALTRATSTGMLRTPIGKRAGELLTPKLLRETY